MTILDNTDADGRCPTCGYLATHSAIDCPDGPVAAVKAHALAHYADGGWDVIVECWEDQQIADALANALEPITTPEEAIKHFADGVVAVWADQQADARNSAF